jgi:hypothetical protein
LASPDNWEEFGSYAIYQLDGCFRSSVKAKGCIARNTWFCVFRIIRSAISVVAWVIISRVICDLSPRRKFSRCYPGRPLISSFARNISKVWCLTAPILDLAHGELDEVRLLFGSFLLKPFNVLLILVCVRFFSRRVCKHNDAPPFGTLICDCLVVWSSRVGAIDDLSHNIGDILFSFSVVFYAIINDTDGITPKLCIALAKGENFIGGSTTFCPSRSPRSSLSDCNQCANDHTDLPHITQHLS